jgi:hypothetical protein
VAPVAFPSPPEVVFIFDHSGSSYGDDVELFRTAQEGAKGFLFGLNGSAAPTLLLLHSQVIWYPRPGGALPDRDALRERIDTQFPDGSLALYDGLGAAFERLRSGPTADRPGVIVVLTPAPGDKSSLTLAELRARARPQAGVRPVSLFVVALGRRGTELANVPTLRRLAEETGGRFYQATPDNLAPTMQALAKSLGRSPAP